MSPQESFLPCENQCFVEKGFFLSPQMSAFLKIRVIIWRKKSVKGVVFSFLERSYVLLLCLSGGTGPSIVSVGLHNSDTCRRDAHTYGVRFSSGNLSLGTFLVIKTRALHHQQTSDEENGHPPTPVWAQRAFG